MELAQKCVGYSKGIELLSLSGSWARYSHSLDKSWSPPEGGLLLPISTGADLAG